MSQGSKNNFEQSQTLEKGPLRGSSLNKKSSRHFREAQSCLKTSVQQEEKKILELEKEEGKEQTVTSVSRNQTKCCPWKESKRLSRLQLRCVLLGKEAVQHLRESPIPRTRNTTPIEAGDWTRTRESPPSPHQATLCWRCGCPSLGWDGLWRGTRSHVEVRRESLKVIGEQEHWEKPSDNPTPTLCTMEPWKNLKQNKL